jgi:LmbE family N-acetylglucosaminyl deacetylase
VAANDPGQPPLSPESGPPTGWSANLPIPASALAIGAHPDDVEFGAGGTLAKWAEAGCVVHHLVCTDGSKGTWDASADLPELVARRMAEQRDAARRLAGDLAGEVVFLGCVDGELDSDRTTRGEVARVIRRLRPDVVLGHDPWKRYRLHPDHRHAGLLTCDAIVAARDPHFHPEHGLAPHRPQALLFWEADQPAHVEDVSAAVERKLHALEAHSSQFESTMLAVDDGQLVAFRARVRGRLAELGAPHDFAAAEVFALITDL